MESTLELERLLPAKEQWIRDFYVGEEWEIRAFASANDDYNPLHHDSAVARKHGLLGICVPGLMVLKFINTSISDKFRGVAVCELQMRMKAPVYAQTRLSVCCSILQRRSRMAKIGIEVRNGDEVVVEGSCTVFLPKPERAEILG